MGWLLAEIGYKNLPLAEEDRLNDIAADTILNRIIVRVADITNPELLTEIRALIKADSPDQLNEFLKPYQINLDQLIDEEIDNYRQEIITVKQLLTKEMND